MKKSNLIKISGFISVLSILTAFTFSSCVTSDLFSKNKTAVTETSAPSADDSNLLEAETSGNTSETAAESLSQVLSENQEETETSEPDIETLVSEKPSDFEEPLVRDLEFSEITPVSLKTETDLNEKTSETENTQPVNILPAENNASEEKTAKSDNSSYNASENTKDSANEDKAADDLSENKSESSGTDESLKKTAEDESVALKNNSEQDHSILTSTGTPDTSEKSTSAPVTSAGTKTETPAQVIPSKPASSSQKNTGSENKAASTEAPVKTAAENTSVVSNETKNKSEEIIPSRTVTLNKGETLIVEYPGNGWIYLGSDHEYNNLESKGRKSGTDKTTYTLVAIDEGTQIQHFYKTDSLSGNYIDDYLEVTVNSVKGSVQTQVKAPDYKQVVPHQPVSPALAADKLTQDDYTFADDSGTKTVKTGERTSFEYTPEDSDEEKSEQYTESYEPENDSTIAQTEDFDSSDLLSQAQALYDEKKYADALKVINVFLDYAVNSRDKGLYLKGQILEAESEIKNIKEAISCYNNLLDNYPASELWDKANKRIIYLKRFYLEAR